MSTRAAIAWCAWMALSAVPDAAVAGSSSDVLVLWHSYRGREEVALSKVLDEYNASHPARQVEALALPYEVLASKLTTAIPRGHGPDLFIFAHERIGGWVDHGRHKRLDIGDRFERRSRGFTGAPSNQDHAQSDDETRRVHICPPPLVNDRL